MKINELMANIHRKDFDMTKELHVKTYLPIEEKKLIAQGIIYECTENIDGVIKIDSVQQYLSYIKYMIKRHTNLEYTQENYDVLCSTEYGDTSLLNAIIGTFQGDANECNRILNLMLNDYIEYNTSENQIIVTVNKLLNRLSDVMDLIGVKVSDFNIEDMMPKDLDLNRLATFLNDNYKK